MCGRVYTPANAEIERAWKFSKAGSDPFTEKYNVAPQLGNPKNYIPVDRQTAPGEARAEVK